MSKATQENSVTSFHSESTFSPDQVFRYSAELDLGASCRGINSYNCRLDPLEGEMDGKRWTDAWKEGWKEAGREETERKTRLMGGWI